MSIIMSSFFFFSSRRRHTRSLCDWSSDVCSSDLAASACLGFPLCNGQVVPAGNYLQHIHWVHRLLAYTLFGYVWWWALRSKQRGAWYAVALVTVQVAVAAAMVLLALPPLLQAAHVAVGAAVWGGLVLAIL